jgi:hypothetical protein
VLLLTRQHWGEVLKKSHWTWCWCRKYNNLDLSVMRKLIHCIIWCFDFWSEPWPTKYPSPAWPTHYNFWKTLRFVMLEFISPKGRYYPGKGHMADNAALCDWAGESQDKLHIIHQYFEHYLSVWTSVMVIYRLVYEYLSLSYCYSFVWCLMKCVPKCELDWILDEMCAWMWFGLNLWWHMCLNIVLSCSDRRADASSPVAAVRLVAMGG